MPLLCFGEGLLRLSPPNCERFEQSPQLQVHIGGAELNVAVAAARLGMHSSWISAVPANAWGERVLQEARAQGVDCTHVQRLEGTRLGIYFLEEGAAPRPSRVIYDRAGSAFAQVEAGSFFWPTLMRGAKAFHVSGITPALGPGPRLETLAALQSARELGLSTSFDFNYRANLWNIDAARACFNEILPLADRVFASRELLQLLMKLRPEEFIAQYKCKELILSRREENGVRAQRFSAEAWINGSYIESDWYDLEIVDRIGGGDALAGAYLATRLQGREAPQALTLASAFAALAHTVPGDLPRVSSQEAEAATRGEGLWVRR